jgi:hypothetical protein
MRNSQKNTALQVAEEIFSNGRIKDPEDWDEMKLELEAELYKGGHSPQSIKDMVRYIKELWY